MKTIKHQADFCVIGGGLAGMCAAIQAARHGIKTILMHERPVLGGNASSEIRMWICGATGWVETGLVEEIRLENLYRNNYPNYSVWDSILYEKVKFQDNLTCLLNCSCQDAVMDGSRIKSVKGWQMTTQTFHEVEAKYFADCSGDSILAPLTGAQFRLGREPRSEFNESLAHETGDKQTMGMSCLLQARETDSPQKFIPPKWAKKYPDDSSFPERDHRFTQWQNYWWLELGGDQDSIGDTEELRDELIKTAFGLWDHIKNHGDHGADNWVLDWVGFLPGKRESRRYVGDYIINENDVLSGGNSMTPSHTAAGRSTTIIRADSNISDRRIRISFRNSLTGFRSVPSIPSISTTSCSPDATSARAIRRSVPRASWRPALCWGRRSALWSALPTVTVQRRGMPQRNISAKFRRC